MAYFVTYQRTAKNGEKYIENIMVDEHPIEWISKRPSGTNNTYVILWWQEVKDSYKKVFNGL